MNSENYGKRKKTQNQLTLFDHGKILPQALDLEKGVIGSLILEAQTSNCKHILNTMRPEIFYAEQNQIIASTLLNMHENDIPIDLLTLVEELRKKEVLDLVGGAYFIESLTDKVISSTNIQYHYFLIYQKYINRELIRISSEVTSSAYNDTSDVFELIDEYINQISHLHINIKNLSNLTAADIAGTFIEQVLTPKTDNFTKNIILTYETGHRRFDESVTISRNKFILIGGGPKHGKSKFLTDIMIRLFERYDDIAAYWCTLEDSAIDIMRSYLAQKVLIKPKHILLRRFPDDLTKTLIHYTNIFRKWDILFRDTPIKIQEAVSTFRKFCDSRPDKFNIFIFDNIMAASDRDDFKQNLNSMYDHILAKLSQAKSSTKSLVIGVHHFNDAQQDKERLVDAYRPVSKDLKGSEASKRVPNQVVLVNFLRKYKDLLGEYEGDEKEILKYLYIIDVAENREDTDSDETSLIHFFANLDFTLFKEIELNIQKTEEKPYVEESVKDFITKFHPI